jgi:hypothetical protein
MSIDYDTDDDGNWYAPDDGDDCTACAGEGDGECPDPLGCCGIDICHACGGTGRRDDQRVF